MSFDTANLLLRLKSRFALTLVGLLVSSVALGAISAHLRYTIQRTPSGKVDTRFPDGNDGTVGIPLAWIPSCVTDQTFTQGTPASWNFLSCVTQPVGNTATYSLLLNGAVPGVSLAGNTIAYSGTGTGTGTYRIRALRASVTADSPSFTINAAVNPGTDLLAPTVPRGVRTTAAANSVIVTWDAASDPYDGTRVGSGLQKYEVLRNGGHLADVAASPGLTLSLAQQTIGSFSPSPTSSISTGIWTLTAAGTGFSGTADQGIARLTQVSGDFTISARVATLTDNGQPFPQACLIARSDLTAGSASAQVCLSVSTSGVRARQRLTAGATATSIGNVTGVAAPACLKLTRTTASNTLTMFYSTDCNAWTQLAQSTVALPTTAYVGPAAASQSASNPITTTFSDVNINSVTTAPTYTHSTGGSGTYTVKAYDLASNVSAASAGVVGAPTVVTQQWKFNPGYYLVLPSLEQLPQAAITALTSTPALKGIKMKYYWATLEPTRGNYDFRLIESHLLQLQGINKRLIIGIWDRDFSGNTPDGVLPPYLATEPNGDGGYLVKGNSTGIVARVWVQAIMDREIALHNALAARFNNEVLVEGMNSEECTPGISPGGATTPPSYSSSAMITQWKRFIDAAAANWTKTNVFIFCNSLNAAAGPHQLIEYAYQKKLGMGGPDVLPPPHEGTPGDRVFRAEPKFVGEFTPIRDYRTLMPAYNEVQSPELGGKEGTFGGTTAAQRPLFLSTFAGGTGPGQGGQTHMGFLLKEFDVQPGPNVNWGAHIKPYLDGSPVPMVTTCPAVYAGNCDTD
jgi:hypothetical protein